MKNNDHQEQVETLLSEIELLIASERLPLQFDNSRLACAIVALPQIGIIEQNQIRVVGPDGEFVNLIPKE